MITNHPRLVFTSNLIWRFDPVRPTTARTLLHQLDSTAKSTGRFKLVDHRTLCIFLVSRAAR